MNDQVAIWVAGIVGTGAVSMLGFFLRGLYRKVENAVSKEEFNSAMQSMRDTHEKDRKELRESQIRIDEKLSQQSTLLVQVATKLELLTSMRPFDQTWGKAPKG